MTIWQSLLILDRPLHHSALSFTCANSRLPPSWPHRHTSLRRPVCQPTERRCTTSCSLSLAGLKQLISGSGKSSGRDPLRQASMELLELVTSSSNTGEEQQRVAELVDVLLAARTRFDESLLGGGPWQVVYTRGALLWEQATNPGKLRRRNRESVGVCGWFEAGVWVVRQDDEELTPKLIKASIERGALHAWGTRIPLPIKGTGYVSLVYCDGTVRVFQDRGGGVSVQVRADKLV